MKRKLFCLTLWIVGSENQSEDGFEEKQSDKHKNRRGCVLFESLLSSSMRSKGNVFRSRIYSNHCLKISAPVNWTSEEFDADHQYRWHEFHLLPNLSLIFLFLLRYHWSNTDQLLSRCNHLLIDQCNKCSMVRTSVVEIEKEKSSIVDGLSFFFNIA